MKYLYIHGANATGQSFNYIRERLKGTDLTLEYSCAVGFDTNLEVMAEKLQDEKDLFIVGHSMGGIYALHLANKFPDQIIGAVTLATPYGGSRVAEIARWVLPYYKLIHDIVPDSKTIKTTRSLPVLHPWTQVVTTTGNVPWLGQPNDGIVSLASMRSRRDIEQIDVGCNHYEVCVSPTVVKIIKERANNTSKWFGFWH